MDVVEKYENEIRRQTEYMKKNIGNIGGSDNYNQKLYKMIGQIKHVNQRLQDFLDQEEGMTRLIKNFKHMSTIFKTFEEIPKKLEHQTQMLATIDAQLNEVKRNF